MHLLRTVSMKVRCCKRVLFTTERMCVVNRHLSTTQLCGSFVQDIRKQMDIKRCSVAEQSYSNGRFLVIDVVKQLVLLSRKSADSGGRISLFWANFDELNSIGVNIQEAAVFLGVAEGKFNFAVNVSPLAAELRSSLESKTNAQFISLRASLFNLDGSVEMPLVSQSHSVLDWKLKHKFCNYCGNTLENGCIEIQKKCSGCKTIHYPTVNPIGIALICDEEYSKVLLVRQPIHPPRMFTCVAGFIESGETIEENIKREVAEELGLEVKNIQYMGSQHWSLPGSKLMIGCVSTVENEKFSLDPVELEEACWFSPEQIHEALKRVTERREKVLKSSKDIWIPPPGAIAHSLIKSWLQKYH